MISSPPKKIHDISMTAMISRFSRHPEFPKSLGRGVAALVAYLLVGVRSARLTECWLSSDDSEVWEDALERLPATTPWPLSSSPAASSVSLEASLCRDLPSRISVRTLRSAPRLQTTQQKQNTLGQRGWGCILIPNNLVLL